MKSCPTFENPERWFAALAGITAAAADLIAADRLAIRRYGRPPRRNGSIDPSSVPRDAVGIELRATDGAIVRGWWRESPSARTPGAAALVMHGWGGSATDMIPVSDVLIALGMHVLLLDARGHGRSDDGAVASMPAFADDIRDALKWIRSTPQVDPSRIALVGHSVGAGAGLFVASGDQGVAAVVSLASMADPSAFMAQLMRRRMPAPMVALALRYVEHTIGHRFTEFAPVYTIGRFKGPVLLLHGGRDTTVPVTDAYLLHAMAAETSTLIVLPQADHFDFEALEVAGPELARFLREANIAEAGDGLLAGPENTESPAPRSAQAGRGH